MLTIDQLQKPEQIKAMQVLKKNLPNFTSLNIGILDTDVLFTTNFTCFCESIVKLPHGESWLWNQSNAKVNISLSDYNVVMQKMNTRRRKNGPKAPFYKLWLYTIKSQINKFQTQFIWCEKGTDPIKPEIIKQTLDIFQNESFTTKPTYIEPTIINNQQQINDINTSENTNNNVSDKTSQETPINNCDLFEDPLFLAFDEIDVDSLLWPTYVYTEHFQNMNNFIESYSTEDLCL